MCYPLSMLVTRHKGIIQVPGAHHHSMLVNAVPQLGHALRQAMSAHDFDLFGPEAIMRGWNAVGVEVNLLRRTVVLDERTLPAWYTAAHDSQLWEWVQANIADKGSFRRWLAEDVHYGWPSAEYRGQMLPFVMAPMRVGRAIMDVWPMGGTRCTEQALDVLGYLEAQAGRWAEPWENEHQWTVSFDQDALAPAVRV